MKKFTERDGEARGHLPVDFHEEDYPPKEILGAIQTRSRGLSRPTSHYRQQARGNETHGNQPGEIGLFNHVPVVKPAMSFIAWIWKQGLVYKNPYLLPILNRLLEKKDIAREYWALERG